MNWTTHAAAPEWGIDRKTLRRRLADAGHDLEKKKNFTTREISEAIYGDEKIERIKGLRLDNEQKEIENAEAREQLYPAETVMSLITAGFLPIRQKFLSLVAECAIKCNPIDPEASKAVLGEWSKVAMRICQADLERVVDEVNEAASKPEPDEPDQESVSASV